MSRWILRGLVSTFASLIVAGMFGQSGPLGFIGGVDAPDSTAAQTGVVVVRGFASALRPLTRIELYVDGVLRDYAVLGLPRIDVVERYAPQYPWLRDARPGFQAAFLSDRFSNGQHSIWLRAYTRDGRSVEFGRRTIIINHGVKASPFPLLNIPDPGGIARIAALLVSAMIFLLAAAAPRGVRSAKEGVDLLVRRLPEVLIPEADGLERLGRAEADHLVNTAAKLRAG